MTKGPDRDIEDLEWPDQKGPVFTKQKQLLAKQENLAKQKQHWRSYFQSLRNQHRNPKTSCSPERFQWKKEEFSAEDKGILSSLKALLSSQQLRGSLWLSYFPRCDEVDIRPLWQELPQLNWAFPSFFCF